MSVSVLAKLSPVLALACGSLLLTATGCASAPDDVSVSADDESGTAEEALTKVVCGGRSRYKCKSDEYCKYAAAAQCGRTDAPGVCAKRPRSCSLNVRAPVCGCDGITYRSACISRLYGTGTLASGACVPEDDVP
jgi:hypothetical protein